MKTYTLRDARRMVTKAQRQGGADYVYTSLRYSRHLGRVQDGAIYLPVTGDGMGSGRDYLRSVEELPRFAAWLDEQIRREGGSSPAILPEQSEDTNQEPSNSEGGEGDSENSVTSDGSGGPGSLNVDSTLGSSSSQECGGERGSTGTTADGSRGAGNSTGRGAGMSASSARTEMKETNPNTGKSTGQSHNGAGNQDFTPHHADKAEGSQMRENVVACGSGTAGHDEDKSWPTLNLTTPGGDLTGVISEDLPHSEGRYSQSANGSSAGSVIDERAVREAASAHKGAAVKLSAALDSLFKRLQEVGNGLDQSPRIDGARLVRELVSKSVRLSQTAKDEMSRRLTIITVDVSPSCEAIASTATAAGIALCQADPSVVLITHSNGYVDSVSGQRKGEVDLGPMGDDGYRKKSTEPWRNMTADKVAGVVAWGDWDAIQHYSVAAENVPVFWLDPSPDTGDLPSTVYGTTYPGVLKIKTYLRGVDTPQKAPIALGKCKF